MIYQHIEKVRGSETDEIIIGDASWDNYEQSVKYAWPDSRGHRARGGEVPVGAMPQMVEALVREGYLPAQAVLRAIARALERSTP
jgi:hypothetical protein